MAEKDVRSEVELVTTRRFRYLTHDPIRCLSVSEEAPKGDSTEEDLIESIISPWTIAIEMYDRATGGVNLTSWKKVKLSSDEITNRETIHINGQVFSIDDRRIHTLLSGELRQGYTHYDIDSVEKYLTELEAEGMSQVVISPAGTPAPLRPGDKVIQTPKASRDFKDYKHDINIYHYWVD